jgi:two-component system, chemotaxis family, sensor kinase CheA
MPDPDTSNMDDFRGQFLEDYYTECLEHLSMIRRHLLAIEVQIGEGTVDVGLLDELFRSFHTIKGISGMVGLSDAEQLAHSIEGLLRLLRQADLALSVPRLDSLIAGVLLLEQLITAHRNKEPLPDILGIVQHLQETAAASAGGSAQTPALRVKERLTDRHDGLASRRWIVEFTPTPALAERGININNVRARLQQAGDIVRSTPQVKGEGEISFRFEIETKPGVESFPGEDLEGLVVTPIEDIQLHVSGEPARPPQTASAVRPVSASPSANVVRVDLSRLDELMRMIGEMVTNRARLEEQIKRLKKSLPAAEWRGLWETNQTMGRQLRDLRQGVMSVRMVPVGEIFERMQFVVRDLARESGKKIALDLVGRETEIDKFLVERMMDPLLHLVRNAVSHGLERPDEREAQGKPQEGRLTLRAVTTGENVVLQIHDDGRGIDRDSVIEHARARGMAAQGPVDDGGLLDIICQPGFSTRLSADRESGRGIGMDVVRKTVSELNGTLTVSTEAGKGTAFTIELPLTLAITDALIVNVGAHTYAVPQTVVREIIEVQPSQVRSLERNEIIAYRDGALPLLRLSKVFKLPDSASSAERGFHVFVTGTGSNALGIAVDRVVGHREIVVRGISDPLAQSRGIAGATDLGDDKVVLILDVAALRPTNLQTPSTLGGRQN